MKTLATISPGSAASEIRAFPRRGSGIPFSRRQHGHRIAVTREAFEGWIAEELQCIEQCVDSLMRRLGDKPSPGRPGLPYRRHSLVPAVRGIFKERFGDRSHSNRRRVHFRRPRPGAARARSSCHLNVSCLTLLDFSPQRTDGCPISRFPVEFSGSVTLCAFPWRKAHTRTCPALRTGNSGYLAVFREMWDTRTSMSLAH